MTGEVHDPERWRVLEGIFQAACDLTVAERPAFLDAACGGDQSLREEVESLLRSANETVGFLKEPIMEAARTISPVVAPGAGRIGPYELDAGEPLGEGGMGRVYLARRADQAYSQKVAIKCMHADIGRDREMLLAFVWSARFSRT